MYRLTLTREERKAIDWVGPRYAHGNDLFSVLLDYIPEDKEWDSEEDITFNLPEHVAWRIREIAEEVNHQWDCFSEALSRKMEDFLEKVV